MIYKILVAAQFLAACFATKGPPEWKLAFDAFDQDGSTFLSDYGEVGRDEFAKACQIMGHVLSGEELAAFFSGHCSLRDDPERKARCHKTKTDCVAAGDGCKWINERECRIYDKYILRFTDKAGEAGLGQFPNADLTKEKITEYVDQVSLPFIQEEADKCRKEIEAAPNSFRNGSTCKGESVVHKALVGFLYSVSRVNAGAASPEEMPAKTHKWLALLYKTLTMGQPFNEMNHRMAYLILTYASAICKYSGMPNKGLIGTHINKGTFGGLDQRALDAIQAAYGFERMEVPQRDGKPRRNFLKRWAK